MFNIKDIVENDLTEIEEELGSQMFTWQGEDYLCIPHTIDYQILNSETAFLQNTDFRMKVRISQFNGIYPQLNDYIYFNGYKLVIKHIRQPNNIFWTFVCNQPTIKR